MHINFAMPGRLQVTVGGVRPQQSSNSIRYHVLILSPPSPPPKKNRRYVRCIRPKMSEDGLQKFFNVLQTPNTFKKQSHVSRCNLRIFTRLSFAEKNIQLRSEKQYSYKKECILVRLLILSIRFAHYLYINFRRNNGR